MVGVLFVCTGNICRSPTAEGVFRGVLVKAGLADRVRVDSAATHAYHIGEPPDPRSIQAARDRGVDISGQRARKVGAADYRTFDLLLAMDGGHRAILQRMAPAGFADRVHLFLDFADGPSRGREVPDPYYGGPEGFRTVLDLCEAGADGLLAEVRRRLEVG